MASQQDRSAKHSFAIVGAVLICMFILATAVIGCGSGSSDTKDNPGDSNGDLQPPSVPANLSCEALSPSQVQLTWTASEDNVAIAGYQIYLDGNLMATTSQTSYLYGGLAPETMYTFSVTAYDAENNISAATDPVQITTPAQSAATALSELAAAMQPGEWAELETSGFGDGAILVTDDDGSILEYNCEANWDPVGRRIYVAGTSRGASASYGMINQKWVQWSEQTNTWTALPQMPFYLGFHSYDHAALDTTTGDYYLRIVGSESVMRYSGGEWSSIADLSLDYVSCCNALEYFADMEALVFVRGNSDGDTEIFKYLSQENVWQRLAEDEDIPMGNFHDFIEYSAVHGIIYFGGGTVYQVGLRSEVYAMDANGEVTRLPDAPIEFDISRTIPVVEPVSGNLLLFPSSDDAVFFEYDYTRQSWSTRSTNPDYPVFGVRGSVAATIEEYGVVMFLRHSFSGSAVVLYKHAPN